ncbi:BnaC09g00950D [Brassica napus]|uniref:BnaC09g00950D protein n=2 Tax=Brassica TaxID=3705 RepID=A0A078G9D5_BRANA|nr:BnaC09g00950D [Brassica napus]
MPKLSHLQLFANKLTDAGLNAILDNCPNLEHLDLRECRSVKLSGDLRKRCSKRIKVLREPFGCIMLTHVLELIYDMLHISR